MLKAGFGRIDITPVAASLDLKAGQAVDRVGGMLGLPFPAGKHLDKFFEAVGIEREEVYIANILKCRPPNNRDPLPEEQDTCIDYLREQVKLIRPKIIVCLGRIAATRLIRPDFRITREHGQWTQRNGIWFMATYHPSALLRDMSKRPEAFEDLLTLREKILELQ